MKQLSINNFVFFVLIFQFEGETLQKIDDRNKRNSECRVMYKVYVGGGPQ
jgi:hypothetical protein